MIFWLLYILAGIAHVICLRQSIPVAIITKVALLPLLALAFRFSLKGKLNTISKAMMAAFFFSWLGDLFLMPKGDPRFFLAGLIAFLIAHLAYIYVFRKQILSTPKISLLINVPYLVLPFAGFLAGMLIWMWDGLAAEMKVPVTIYTICIITMWVMAFNRWGLVQTKSFWAVFIGAALFVISDSMIAIDKFIEPFNGAREAIMTTYISAQFLIAWGMMESLGGRLTADGRF